MFIHVPKTAGSSVTNYMVRRFGHPILTNRTTFKSTYRQRGFITPPGHFTAHDLVEFQPADLDLCFAIIRDPMARLLSEFRYQKIGGGRLAQNFSTWLRLMIETAKLDPRIYHNHIRPQSDFLSENCEFFRLEEGLARLVERFDQVEGQSTDDAIERINSSDAVKEPIRITRQDAALIASFYHEDYKRFGYDAPQSDNGPTDSYAPTRDIFARLAAPILLAKEKRRWLK